MKKRKRIDKETIKEIKQLYESGHSIYEIADTLNINPTTVYYHVKNTERSKATKGEIDRLIKNAREFGFDERKVKQVIPSLTKREIIMYSLNLMRLKPFVEKLNLIKS